MLRLTEGVNRPEETLRNYVVTPQLVVCFDQALSLIRSAVESNSSKGAYLHGSFGSGKSHFMAVLTLLLQSNPAARSIPELDLGRRLARASCAPSRRFTGRKTEARNQRATRRSVRGSGTTGSSPANRSATCISP